MLVLLLSSEVTQLLSLLWCSLSKFVTVHHKTLDDEQPQLQMLNVRGFGMCWLNTFHKDLPPE